MVSNETILALALLCDFIGIIVSCWFVLRQK